jgi:hypothetical protein
MHEPFVCDGLPVISDGSSPVYITETGVVYGSIRNNGDENGHFWPVVLLGTLIA